MTWQAPQKTREFRIFQIDKKEKLFPAGQENL